MLKIQFHVHYLVEMNICCQTRAFWQQISRVQLITLRPKKPAQILPPFLYFSCTISCSEHANAETQERPFNCGVIIALLFFLTQSLLSRGLFLPLPALHQPCAPPPLHTEHRNLGHTCPCNMFSKISLSTRFTSIFLLSLSQVHSVDFVTRFHQLSALQYFGTKFEAYRFVSPQVLGHAASFAVHRKV